MEEGTILSWLKADGDLVEAGEDLVEIETDKATDDLPGRRVGHARDRRCGGHVAPGRRADRSRRRRSPGENRPAEPTAPATSAVTLPATAGVPVATTQWPRD